MSNWYKSRPVGNGPCEVVITANGRKFTAQAKLCEIRMQIIEDCPPERIDGIDVITRRRTTIAASLELEMIDGKVGELEITL